uniref:Protein serine/threonine kinase n=1 Tax=Corethrella appendiculata TaxID=1370023 RepID=U5EWH7_9DIPT
MKFLLVAVFALIAVAYAADDPKYTTKYDGVDLDEILKSDRLFNNYYKCLMDKGRCTPDGKELKRLLPDALKTECSKCSEKQRQGTEKVINYLIEKKGTQWKDLQAKYDPENIYAKKYLKLADERGYEISAKARAILSQ